MVRKTIRKIKNPQVGIYSIRYRDIKGLFTGALSKAASFQYVTKSGRLSRQIDIPREIKKADDKQYFIYIVLGKIINANEKRKETAARKRGTGYQKILPEEKLEIPEEYLIELRESYPEIFPTPKHEYFELVPESEFNRRRIQARKNKPTGYLELYSWDDLTFRTDGIKTPMLNGEIVNWVDYQRKIGFIKKVQKKIQRTRKNKRTGKITKYETTVESDFGMASIMFFFTRTLRSWFISNRTFIQAKHSKKSLYSALKLRLVTNLTTHTEPMYSDETYFIPRRLSAKAYKNRINGIVWRMAKEALRLLNDDFPDVEEPKGGLTSSEIYTKIRFVNNLYNTFLTDLSIMAVPYKSIPEWLEVNMNTGYLKDKAFYDEDEK